VHHGVDPSTADLALERRKVTDVRDADVGTRIEIRSDSSRKIVDDHDVVAAREERIDDVATEKTRAARDEYVQPTAAPSSRCRAFFGTVDEIVEEKVDKTRGHPHSGALGSIQRAELPPRSRRGGGSLFISERLF
jgi:hypothetical protein